MLFHNLLLIDRLMDLQSIDIPIVSLKSLPQLPGNSDHACLDLLTGLLFFALARGLNHREKLLPCVGDLQHCQIDLVDHTLFLKEAKNYKFTPQNNSIHLMDFKMCGSLYDCMFDTLIKFINHAKTCISNLFPT